MTATQICIAALAAAPWVATAFFFPLGVGA